MVHTAIVYVSTYGHTSKQADAVALGAEEIGMVSRWQLDESGEMPSGIWDDLEQADAIIFGSPTYMGGPAWPFKKFADTTSEIWVNRSWQNKLAGGFTTSATVNGDKGETLSYFITLANQHGMLWVSLGQASPNLKADGPADMNWTGGNGGAMAIAPSDAGPDEAPSGGDLASAKAYGARIAELAKRFAGG
ncbi:MAG: flavodoxin family protein [Litoreibacter sp.]